MAYCYINMDKCSIQRMGARWPISSLWCSRVVGSLTSRPTSMGVRSVGQDMRLVLPGAVTTSFTTLSWVRGGSTTRGETQRSVASSWGRERAS